MLSGVATSPVASMRPGANRRDQPPAWTWLSISATGFNEARRESPGSGSEAGPQGDVHGDLASMRPGANRRDQGRQRCPYFVLIEPASMRPGANRRDQGLFARYRSVDRCAIAATVPFHVLPLFATINSRSPGATGSSVAAPHCRSRSDPTSRKTGIGRARVAPSSMAATLLCPGGSGSGGTRAGFATARTGTNATRRRAPQPQRTSWRRSRGSCGAPPPRGATQPRARRAASHPASLPHRKGAVCHYADMPAGPLGASRCRAASERPREPPIIAAHGVGRDVWYDSTFWHLSTR